jgi:periplasmic divalent cation tolerance protein
MNNKDIFVILSTCPDAATAERLGRTLVEEALAACVNVLPGLRSIYRWNDAVQCDEEALMIIKTTSIRFAAARERLVALHPYEVPEVVALPVAAGHQAYLEWVAASTRTPQT